jgi:acyl-CoA dehydrogenase
MGLLFFVLYLLFTLQILYHKQKALVWEIGTCVFLVLGFLIFRLPLAPLFYFLVVVLLIDSFLRIAPLRKQITSILFERAKKTIPKLSSTEEEALNAGDTWFERDLFIGEPNWNKLSKVNSALTAEEAAFLNNETQNLCNQLDEWQISQERDLPESVWQYIKDNGFFGLVISKEYDGKGFSARAHSEVVLKISTRSSVAAVTVMVPNSLGPGELLQHYGTSEQKSHYLPRLAKGLEIPCFALTEPEAGSDATSIQSSAIVETRQIDGESVLGARITLNKRWITLSPVATLIGLAVNLQDPNGLLNGLGREGITCFLISRDTDNLEIGNRHIPAAQHFMNGTIRGENLFVPLHQIIGGQEMAGQGWRMLVECLSIGRSISLPSLATGSSSVAYITSGAFCRLRRQFNTELRHFEGIEEKLAEIAGLNYLINATRLLTVSAVDEHKKPSVASAITKYFNTEFSRIAIIAAMDIHGGRAVVEGPRNYLASYYQSLPIAITVEGANIMSRNLLIFGQGSMACHPFIRNEFYALSNDDHEGFSKLIWGHIQYFLTNFAKTICSAWTGGIFIGAPRSKFNRSYQQIARLSYAYAWISDFSLIVLGGKLKRKERLSARLADGLSYLYMAMAALHLYEQNKNTGYEVHAKWAVKYCLFNAQKSLMQLTKNLPSRLTGWFIRLIAFPFGQTFSPPSDKLDHQLAQTMVENNEYRNLLLDSIFLSGDINQPIDRVEHGLQLLIKNQELYNKVGKSRKTPSLKLKEAIKAQVDQGILTSDEADSILELEQARWDAILVDEFSMEDIKNGKFSSTVAEKATPFD